MAKKLILSQKQLDEICGGNSAYLDNPIGDFKNIGNNEVSADGFIDGREFGEPMTGDKWAMTDRGRQYTGIGTRGRGKVSYMTYESKENDVPVIYEVSKKKNWLKKNLNEEYRDANVTNATFTTGNKDSNGNPEKRNLGSMKMEKTRFRAAQKLAQSSDPSERKRGLSTIQTMKKNDPNIENELGQYSSVQKNAANVRDTDNKLLGKPIRNKKGGSKSTGLYDDGEFDNGIITYDS